MIDNKEEQPFLQTADPIIQAKAGEFLSGFNSAVEQELKAIMEQARNIERVIKFTRNMD